MIAADTPLVSVVTPFFNTADHLAECIESVLAQTYPNFEYVLVNNRSTDGSAEIAERYAKRDSRVRVVHNSEFLSQVDNYNHALRCISSASKYCKIVQADDWIYPTCIEQMVSAAESAGSVALVGSYSLFEPLPVYGPRSYVGHTGLTYTTRLLPGREVLQRYFTERLGLFGSPTCVMFRSSDVRAASAFFRTDSPVEDIEACFDVLRNGDFAFVHQVLTFNRREEGSLWWRMSSWNADAVNKLIILQRHGRDIFGGEEYERVLKRWLHSYYSFLGEAALDWRNKEFWRFHRDGLAVAGLKLERASVGLYAAWALLKLLACPRTLVARTIRQLSGG